MGKTVTIGVRFTPAEAKNIRAIVKASGGTISEFVRTCVNTSMAQQGDPEALKLLEKMFSEGVQKMISLKVKAAMKEQL